MLKIDAHNHYWRYNPQDYSWIDDDMTILKRDFSPKELKPSMERYDIDGLVAVQACQDHEDNDFLLQQSMLHPSVKGVVGWVNLSAEDVAEHLESYAGFPKFVGIRHMVQSEPDENFLLREDFRRGVALLKSYDLAYDILISHAQLPDAIKFVELFPDQKFVLDHIAKPPIKAGIIDPWRENVRNLAKNPQVLCKLSGLVTEADWKEWKVSDIKPYLDVVFDAFGPERLMFGSDWPVCLLAADYDQVYKIISDYIAQFRKEDQEKIMGINAIKFYDLDLGK